MFASIWRIAARTILWETHRNPGHSRPTLCSKPATKFSYLKKVGPPQPHTRISLHGSSCLCGFEQWLAARLAGPGTQIQTDRCSLNPRSVHPAHQRAQNVRPTLPSPPPTLVSALACPHGMAECWLMQNILKKKNANNVGYAVATTSAPRTPAPCPLNPTSSPSRRSNRPSADSKNGRTLVLPRQEPAILAFHSPHTPPPPPLALSYATEPPPHATKPPPGRH